MPRCVKLRCGLVFCVSFFFFASVVCPKPLQEADKFFVATAKGMNSRHGSWPYNSVRKELKDEMREFASERLQLVQVGTVCFSLAKVIVRSCPLNNKNVCRCTMLRVVGTFAFWFMLLKVFYDWWSVISAG